MRRVFQAPNLICPRAPTTMEPHQIALAGMALALLFPSRLRTATMPPVVRTNSEHPIMENVLPHQELLIHSRMCIPEPRHVALVSAARQYFLDEIARTEPGVLADLESRVLPVYYQWCPDALTTTSWKILQTPELKSSQKTQRLRESLEGWALSWQLRDASQPAPLGWLYDVALHTMSAWNTARGNTTDKRWHHPTAPTQMTPSPMRYELQFTDDQGWNPDLFEWNGFAEHMLDVFRDELAEYRRRVEQIMQESSQAPTDSNRSPEHFRWFVRFQVSGREYVDMWSDQECDIAADEFYEALDHLAGFIGIPRRPARKGRPPVA